jgi:signal transduction histidine kinase
MKKLLNKTLRVFTVYALVVLSLSVPVYYLLVDSIWQSELDEHNEMVAADIEAELNHLQLDDSTLTKSITLWNKIQSGTIIESIAFAKIIADSFYTVEKPKIHSTETNLHRFRTYTKQIILNKKPYRLTVETNIEETSETVAAIAITTVVFFLILVIGFLIITKRLSESLWKPFRETLSKLQAFKLNSQTPIEFAATDTREFEELNQALSKLIEQNISVYKTQKEFAENASHELQTPLAIIKNKLDLLLQREELTERQYRLIEEINLALTRSTRINRNLLLLAKIENYQYDDKEQFSADTVLLESLDVLMEYALNKEIQINRHIGKGIILTGNKTLVEILISNLLLNAIRHNVQKGIININLNADKLTISNSAKESLIAETVFKRFAKTSNESAGTGLGLSIIKEICNRHGWTIEYRFENAMHYFSIAF